MKKIINQKDLDFFKNYFGVTLYDTLLDSAFLGYHGRVLVDQEKDPHILFVDVGGTVYYYGDASSKEAKDFALLIEDYAEIQASNEWIELIKEVHKDKVHDKTRYQMDDASFNLEHLNRIISSIPSDLKIMRIDATLYHQLLDVDWLSSMVENFQDEEDFLLHGLGFVLVNRKGEFLSAASSFTRYSQGFEVEIGTNIQQRRKGYAMMIGAYFIKEVMLRGLHAHWDAANKGSMHLAEKLGYKLKKEYHIKVVY